MTSKQVNWTFFPRISPLIFLVLLLLVSYYFNFQNILTLKPQSIHFWRQTDCLSITLNYCKEDRGFLEPSTHHIGIHDNGNTVSDFPLIYFIIGRIWRITGVHEYVFRSLVLLIFFTGLFSLFRTIEKITSDSLWGIAIALLFLTSPILAFYGTSFLMNVPAYSLALTGWFFFYNFYSSNKTKWLWISCLIFLTGGLLKISSLLSYTGIITAFIIELSGRWKLKKEGRIFNRPRLQAIPVFGVLLLTVAWVLYAKWYNDMNNRGYFLVGISPIWNMPYEVFKDKVYDFFSFWIFQKYSSITQGIAFMSWLLVIISPGKVNRFIYFMNLILPLGFISYIMLFGEVLVGHDYYWIDPLIVMVFTMAGFVTMLKNRFPVILETAKMAFYFLLLYNLLFCYTNLYERYHGMFA